MRFVIVSSHEPQANDQRKYALSFLRKNEVFRNGCTESCEEFRSQKKTGRNSKNTRWSGGVTRKSNALDLEGGVFTWSDPKRIAASLKRSAEESSRRKAEPFRSALSMLTFFINRGGRNLPARRRRILERAKVELRRQFGRA